MSWDLFVQDIPASATSAAEIPDDFNPGLIGTRANIITRIQEVAPTADFTKPDWGVINAPDYSIEISIDEAEDVSGFALHVRGDDQVIPVITRILDHLGLRAFDPSSETGIFVPDEAIHSLRQWKTYRDQIVTDPH